MASFRHKPHVITVFSSGVMDQKVGPETVPSGAFRLFLEKSCPNLADFMHVHIEVDSAFIMPQTGTIHYCPFWSYGPKKGSRRDQIGPKSNPSKYLVIGWA